MQANEAGREKTAVEYLNFGAKTAKRVTWEAWEFTIFGPRRVKVTNASYGYQKDDHAYEVEVGEYDGRGVPLACECPADQYREDYDCKHKVALAAVGGPTVIDAALSDEGASQAVESPEGNESKRIQADGGCECDASEFPCWECYQTGRRELP